MEARCDTHPKVTALAPCSGCGRAFCDPCLSALVDGLVSCDGCTEAARARSGRPWAFAAVVLVACGAGSFAFARAEARRSGEPTWSVYVMACVFALAFAGFIVSRKRVGAVVAPREAGEVLDEARLRGGPYRDPARAPAARRLPPVSGRLTAFTLVMSFAFSALAVPFALHLPRWVETELVLGAGWLTWTGVLTMILFRGGRVADDHRFVPSFWFFEKKKTENTAKEEAPKQRKQKEKKKRATTSSSGGGASWYEGLGSIGDLGDAGEGCLIVLGALLLAGGAILTAWLLVELVIPALFTVAYLLLIRALKVATQDPTCQGSPMRSIARGLLYATMFFGPVVVLTVIVHVVARRSGAF